MSSSPHRVVWLRGPAAIALAALIMGAGLFGISVVAGAVDTREQPVARPPVRDIGARVSVTARDDARVAVDLPAGWGVTRKDGDLLFLASPSRCHTATVKAFPDRSSEAVAVRARRMLGYLAGSEFDGGRLWSGTVAGGRGFATYDPELLLGVEAVRHGGRRYLVLVHGMPGPDERCAEKGAPDVRLELSRLLQDLRMR
ncbi:MAG: hypothetical protein ACSLFR_01830 [Solirubrobacteraceae bacterium]